MAGINMLCTILTLHNTNFSRLKRRQGKYNQKNKANIVVINNFENLLAEIILPLQITVVIHVHRYVLESAKSYDKTRGRRTIAEEMTD